ncbi:MAG: ATP-binding protein, partial [Bacteroidetes bacterium]
GRLHFEAHPGPCRAPIHPAHFANVIHNLLDNALKYSPETVDIEVRTFCQGRQAGLSVRDRGIGIPRAEQGRIFDKFHKLTQGDLHPVKGFGLGLSYVKQVMRHHRGSVQVSSQPGQGATFTLLLPMTS